MAHLHDSSRSLRFGGTLMGKKSRLDRTIGDGARSYVFPAVADYGDWQAWRELEKPLHIDKFITAFALLKPGRRDSGKLRSPQELAALRIYCPYHYVRHSISMAIGRGDLWVKFVQHHRAESERPSVRTSSRLSVDSRVESYTANKSGRFVGMAAVRHVGMIRSTPAKSLKRLVGAQGLEPWTR
jgi:hypothetical protein